jgi:hypothetical protein
MATHWPMTDDTLKAMRFGGSSSKLELHGFVETSSWQPPPCSLQVAVAQQAAASTTVEVPAGVRRPGVLVLWLGAS